MTTSARCPLSTSSADVLSEILKRQPSQSVLLRSGNRHGEERHVEVAWSSDKDESRHRQLSCGSAGDFPFQLLRRATSHIRGYHLARKRQVGECAALVLMMLSYRSR